MTTLIKSLTASLIILFSFSAQALTFELSAFYLTDELKSTIDTKSNRMFYDGAIIMTSEGKTTIGVGWSYAGLSINEENGLITNKYSSTETGPKFIYLFGKGKEWYSGLTYNLSAKAKFENNSGNAEWRGTSIRAEFGYLPQITAKLQAGVKLNYHAASYTEQITNSSTLTQSTNKRNLIYPTFSMVYTF